MARSVCRLSQISYALKAPDLCEGGPLRIQRKGAFGVFLALRPGAENILRFLPSQLRHQDVEYPRSTFSPSGCQRYDVHREPDARGVGTVISADSQMLLKRLKKYCMEHSIRVAYAMPWLYCDGSRLSTYKETFARFLYEMNKLVPVLRDPTLGTDTDPYDFADAILTLALRQRLPPLGPASSDGFARRGAAFLWGAPSRYCLSALAGSLQPSSSSEFYCCGIFFLPSHIRAVGSIPYAKRL